jgi:hypothetical protein
LGKSFKLLAMMEESINLHLCLPLFFSFPFPFLFSFFYWKNLLVTITIMHAYCWWWHPPACWWCPTLPYRWWRLTISNGNNDWLVIRYCWCWCLVPTIVSCVNRENVRVGKNKMQVKIKKRWPCGAYSQLRYHFLTTWFKDFVFLLSSKYRI